MDRKIQINSEIDRTELFGNMDVNLQSIHEAADVEIVQRDDQVILKGESEEALDLAETIIGEFIAVLEKGEPLDKQKTLYIINLKKEGKLILLASHNREDIDILCDEVYEMEMGELKRIKNK